MFSRDFFMEDSRYMVISLSSSESFLFALSFDMRSYLSMAFFLFILNSANSTLAGFRSYNKKMFMMYGGTVWGVFFMVDIFVT